MDIGRSDARSHESRSPERVRSRSLLVRQTTDSAPKARPNCLTACRHSRGTTSFRPPATRRPPPPLPHSTTRGQSPPRIAADAHAAPPADDPATASEDVQLDHFVDACSFPSQLLTFEMLRRLIEFTQYLSVRYTERLSESGIEPSVGSRGDSYDNALAESVIGLYKTEVIRKDGPWKGVDDVEFATLHWVSWFNDQRLPGTDWRHTTGRVRTDVLSAATVPPRRGRTQLKLSPENPGWFNPNRPKWGALYQGKEFSHFEKPRSACECAAVVCSFRGFGRVDMGKLLRRLLFFGLLFEGLGMTNLPGLLTTITVAIAATVFTHLLLVRSTNSA